MDSASQRGDSTRPRRKFRVKSVRVSFESFHCRKDHQPCRSFIPVIDLHSRYDTSYIIGEFCNGIPNWNTDLVFQSRPQNPPQEEASKSKTLIGTVAECKLPITEQATLDSKNTPGGTPPHSSMTTVLPPSFSLRVKGFSCPMNKDTVSTQCLLAPHPSPLRFLKTQRPNRLSTFESYSSPIFFSPS